MWITMKETRRGCEDGFTVRRYMKGETYDVAELQARAFLGAGHAVLADPVVAQNQEAAKSTITQGELLTILGMVKHVYPKARIFNPQGVANG